MGGGIWHISGNSNKSHLERKSGLTEMIYAPPEKHFYLIERNAFSFF